MSSDLTSIQSQFNLNPAKSNSEIIYEFENFRLDGAHLMLYQNEREVGLAPKVVETLLALIERRGEIVSKKEMMDRLWADSFVEESNLTQNIYLLRKTLGKAADGRDLIETFRRRGYRFNGEIKSVGREKETLTEQKSVSNDETTAAETAESEFSLPKKRFAATKFAPTLSGKTKIYLAVAGLAVILLLLAGSFTLSRILNRQNSVAPDSLNSPATSKNISLTRLTPAQNTSSPTISPDGQFLAYTTVDKDGKVALWLKEIASGKTTRLQPPVAKNYNTLQFSPDGRQIYYLDDENDVSYISLSGGEPQKIVRDTAGGFALSPDGRQIAFVRRKSLIIADASGERVLAERAGEARWFPASRTTQPAWSPDGARIVIVGGYTELGEKHLELLEIDVESGRERRIPTPDWAQIGDVVWLTNGNALLIIAGEKSNSPKQIWQLSYPNGAVSRLTNDLNSYEALSLTADSRSLVTMQVGAGLNLWLGSFADLSRFEQITFNQSEIVGRGGLAFAPDGRIIYDLNATDSTNLWSINSDGANPQLLTTPVGEGKIPARQVITPDGRYVIFISSYNSGRRNIWRMNAAGGDLRQLTSNQSVDYLSLSPDGQWIYFTDEGGKLPIIYKISAGGGASVPVSGDFSAIAPSVSPDGKLIAYLHADKSAPDVWKVGVMSAETGVPLKFFDIAPHRRVLHWMADSESLLYIGERSPDLWRQPLDGSAPSQLTNFPLEETWNFALSPDRQKIVVSRGNISTEIVLIKISETNK